VGLPARLKDDSELGLAELSWMDLAAFLCSELTETPTERNDIIVLLLDDASLTLFTSGVASVL
jgi:hypothetical protein